jgi:hypothetical protein
VKRLDVDVCEREEIFLGMVQEIREPRGVAASLTAQWQEKRAPDFVSSGENLYVFPPPQNRRDRIGSPVRSFR